MISKKNKKGLSELIGYVLLVSAVLGMSIVVYGFLKTYVPVAQQSCPEDVSIYIEQINCSTISGVVQLNLSLRNNGKFNVGGYFINARNSTNFVNLNLIKNRAPVLGCDIEQSWMSPGVKFIDSNSNENPALRNPMSPEDVYETFFNFTGVVSNLSIEIIPLRWEGYKMRIVTCSSAKVSQEVSCS